METGFSLGQKVTRAAIPQVCGYAQQCPDQEAFWRAFFSGMAGAMAAQIGVTAAGHILAELIGVSADAAEIINKKTH